MATLHGMLGQLAPVGGVLSSLYVVPSNKHITAKIVVCNRSTVDLFRVAVSPGGAAIDSKHYLAFDQPLTANEAVSSTAFTIKGGDIVRVYSTNGNCSFSLTGLEEDD